MIWPWGYQVEPLLLFPLDLEIIGNIPLYPGLSVGIYEEGSVLNILHHGVQNGWYPPLIFLGIGAMTDFSSLISNPKLLLIGAAAQFGIFAAYAASLFLGFEPQAAGAIGIIGGADGPTAIFLSSRLAPDLLGAIAVSAYSYMALVPLIQPPIMKLFTTKKERLIKMKPARAVSKTENHFPHCRVAAYGLHSTFGILCWVCFLWQLAERKWSHKAPCRNSPRPLIDVVTILIGLTVGASTQADKFLQMESIKIFALGAMSFIVATAAGVLFVKVINLFLKPETKSIRLLEMPAYLLSRLGPCV